tara:strand:+ start:410 stop:616 length:207 start_codon:yes stop_codon:yes gene_type:complete
MDKISSEKRFRHLFKKRKSFIIAGALVFCLIAFGIGESISFIVWLIAGSPLVVIFWSSFGERIRDLFK